MVKDDSKERVDRVTRVFSFQVMLVVPSLSIPRPYTVTVVYSLVCKCVVTEVTFSEGFLLTDIKGLLCTPTIPRFWTEGICGN